MTVFHFTHGFLSPLTFEVKDQPRLGICDVLELRPDRFRPAKDFGQMRLIARFRSLWQEGTHGLVEYLLGARCYILLAVLVEVTDKLPE
jgi:hypothetical protein